MHGPVLRGLRKQLRIDQCSGIEPGTTDKKDIAMRFTEMRGGEILMRPFRSAMQFDQRMIKRPRFELGLPNSTRQSRRDTRAARNAQSRRHPAHKKHPLSVPTPVVKYQIDRFVCDRVLQYFGKIRVACRNLNEIVL